jgi:hypothetical protein
MSNLRLLNETTVISGVSAFSVTDIFSADYDIYKIVIDDVVSANGYWYLRPINSSGSVITTSMDNATLLLRADTTYVEYKGTNAASWWATSNICYSSGNNGVFYIFNPYSSSTYSFMLGSDTGYAFSHNRTNKNIGVYKNTVSITGIQISQQSGGTFTAGQIRTYGLRVDS